MLSAPWAAGLTTDPTVRRLREDASRILSSGGVWSFDAMALELQALWGQHTPPSEWLAAALADDPRLWRLPDGRWLHVPSATDGRHFTVLTSTVFHQTGILPADGDVATALLGFESWDRIPVSTCHGRGLVERVRRGSATTHGGSLLVCPRSLVPSDTGMVAVIPGPEGVRLDAIRQPIDAMADRRYRRALRRQLREHPASARAADHRGSVPRPWSLVDAELAVLAVDVTTRRSVVSPLSTAVADGEVDGAAWSVLAASSSPGRPLP